MKAISYKDRGKTLESALSQIHDLWEALGVASLIPIPVPIGQDKETKEVFYKHKMPFDFIGTLYTGRSICVEAKMTRVATIPISGKRGIKPHQAQAIIKHGKMRAISLIVWLREDLMQKRILPWWLLESLLEQDSTQITWESLSDPKYLLRDGDYLKLYEHLEDERWQNAMRIRCGRCGKSVSTEIHEDKPVPVPDIFNRGIEACPLPVKTRIKKEEIKRKK